MNAGSYGLHFNADGTRKSNTFFNTALMYLRSNPLVTASAVAGISKVVFKRSMSKSLLYGGIALVSAVYLKKRYANWQEAVYKSQLNFKANNPTMAGGVAT